MSKHIPSRVMHISCSQGHGCQPCTWLVTRRYVGLAVIILLITLGYLPRFLKRKYHLQRPNIIFILVDDMGWNDVGFNNPKVRTPNINKLATSGLILNQSYVQPICTPSRAALMTGRYPFKIGRQHSQIKSTQPSCLDVSIPLLPQKLKEVGYATLMSGKWHLGLCSWKCTPTYRGFERFFGLLHGSGDHYLHTTGGYLDLWQGRKPYRKHHNQYSTDLLTEKAVAMIDNVKRKRPFFLYLSYQAVHQPLQVPPAKVLLTISVSTATQVVLLKTSAINYEQVSEKFGNMYKKLKDYKRRTFLGMTTYLDRSIGRLVSALRRRRLYENTVIIFSSDNGGHIRSGNNYPLRGGKGNVFEGGTRVPAFVHSPLLEKTGIRHNGLFHVVDWFPTILSIAGHPEGVNFGGGVDGLDQWEMLVSGSKSKRKEFIYNINDHTPPIGHSAIRVGDYKLIQGYMSDFSLWLKPPEQGLDGHVFEERVRNSTPKDLPLITGFAMRMEKQLKPRLFNLKDDPCEKRDLASKLPKLVRKLQDRLEIYKRAMVPAEYPNPLDLKDTNAVVDGTWMPGWCSK